MKKNLVIIVILLFVFIIAYKFSGSNKLDNYLPFFLTSDGWNRYEREINAFTPTEIYETTHASGAKTVLEISNSGELNTYRLLIGNVLYYGQFNYERGRKNDTDATVYVLNWQKPESEQKVFVKKSGTNNIVELNSKREEVVPKIELKKE